MDLPTCSHAMVSTTPIMRTSSRYATRRSGFSCLILYVCALMYSSSLSRSDSGC